VRAQIAVFEHALAVAALGRADGLQQPLAEAALAGGAGGVVSVLMRTSRGQLALNHEFGAATIHALGVGRLLLGAMLGAALYVLLTAGSCRCPTAPREICPSSRAPRSWPASPSGSFADAGGAAPATSGGQGQAA
jgi:hypothetical protein